MKKTILLSICILCAIAAHSQTRLIALKSHSGTAANYRTESFGNFGAIQIPRGPELEKVEKLNDSTVILTNRMSDTYFIDTVMYHPQFSAPGATEKSLRKLYNNKVEFKNFDKKEPAVFETTSDSTEGPGNYPNGTLQQETPAQVPVGKTKSPHRKRNAILLFIIGGGTFFGTGMIAAARRRKKTVASYA